MEQYAKQHTRFSAPADSEQDFNEQYVQAFHEHGYTEDDAFFDDYMYQAETARDRAEWFLKKRPLPQPLWHCVMTYDESTFSMMNGKMTMSFTHLMWYCL